MTVDAIRPVVTSTYALLASHGTVVGTEQGDYNNRRILLKNGTGTAQILLGGPDTASNQRFPWEYTDGALAVELEPGEELWASASTDQTVYVLRNG